MSLPEGKEPSDFTSVEFEHPKGKPVTFFCSEDELLELHYHSPRIGDYSSFVTDEDQTTSEPIARAITGLTSKFSSNIWNSESDAF